MSAPGLRILLAGLLVLALWVTARVNDLRWQDAETPVQTLLATALAATGARIEPLPAKPGTVLEDMVAFRPAGCSALHYALPQRIGYDSSAQFAAFGRQSGAAYALHSLYGGAPAAHHSYPVLQLISLTQQVAAVFGQPSAANPNTSVLVLVPEACTAVPLVDLRGFWQPGAGRT